VVEHIGASARQRRRAGLLTLIGDRFPGLADLLAGAPDADLFERLRAGGSSKQAAWAEERDGRKCIVLSALSL
jgi:hypothetical protein